MWINLLISRSKKQYSGITANTLKKHEQRVDIIINSFEPQNHFVVSLHNETIFEVICYDHHNQTMKSSTLSTGFRGISQLGSAFVFLRWFKLAHICSQVTSLHKWRKHGINHKFLFPCFFHLWFLASFTCGVNLLQHNQRRYYSRNLKSSVNHRSCINFNHHN